jgi:hypothetical protein
MRRLYARIFFRKPLVTAIAGVLLIVAIFLSQAWTLFVMIGVTLLVMTVGMRLALAWGARKNADRKIELSYSDSGVVLSIRGARTEFEWDYFRRFGQNRLLYMLEGSYRVLGIPKRAFPSPDAERDFVETAKMRIHES